MEEWKSIEGYQGKYEVSSLGRVKLLKCKWVKENRILKEDNHEKYPRVCLSKGSPRVQKVVRIHRLVGFAFLDLESHPTKTINHIDGNPLNNRVENLEIISLRENVQHAWEVLGSHKKAHESIRAKLSKEQVLEIREKRNLSNPKLALIYGVSKSTIGNIKNFKTYNYDI
jgi:heterodisulfide reductase subunit A-like polyferredoxin